jgi:hypothetical protein
VERTTLRASSRSYREGWKAKLNLSVGIGYGGVFVWGIISIISSDGVGERSEITIKVKLTSNKVFKRPTGTLALGLLKVATSSWGQ